MIVYAAGPVTGQSWEQATGWREQLSLALPGFTVLSPLRGKSYIAGEKCISPEYDQGLSRAAGIVMQSRYDVTHADILIANLLDTERVSIGTVMEIAWADMMRKPIILIMKAGCAHDHPMIRHVAGLVVATVDEAAQGVQQLGLFAQEARTG